MKQTKRWRTSETAATVLIAAAVALAATPAAAKKMKPVYPIEEARTVDAATAIRVLPPLVRFGSYPGGESGQQHDTEEIGAWLSGISGEALDRRGFRVVAPDEVDPAHGEAAERIRAVADQYVKSRRGPDATVELVQETVASNAPDGGPAAVLIQYLEVKMGSKGYWNGTTGQLGVGMSNSHLRGVLVDGRTGEVLWRGELYYRDVPRIDNAKWNSYVTQMYTTLLTEGEAR